MTPEETAREIVETTIVEMLTTDDRETWIATVAAAIRDAYEQAAVVVDEYSKMGDLELPLFKDIAARIRALKGAG